MIVITGLITRKDIEKGKIQEAELCPLALSLKRRTGYPDVEVYAYYIRLSGPGRKTLTAKPPDDLGWWTEQYDSGVPVSPRRFRLEFKRRAK